jgi:hypothetical protein
VKPAINAIERWREPSTLRLKTIAQAVSKVPKDLVGKVERQDLVGKVERQRK